MSNAAKTYQEPEMEVVVLFGDDVRTAAGDNDGDVIIASGEGAGTWMGGAY